MSEQDGRQATAIQRPTTTDPGAWNAYWEAKGQEWRIEPEISSERQQYLAERRSITPSIEQGIYSFKGIEPKLNRADVEWLLATHENGRGPVDWNDPARRNRQGLDLRGAELRAVDLHNLPLTCIRGGLGGNELNNVTTEQSEKAAIHLENTNLVETHLEEAYLYHAHIEGANLSKAHLEGADCRRTNLEGSNLSQAYLGADENAPTTFSLTDLRMESIDRRTNLEGIILGSKQFGYALLADVNWGDANLTLINWEGIDMLGDEREARNLNVPDKKDLWHDKVKARTESEEVQQRERRKNTRS